MSSFNLLSIGTQALQANAGALSVVGQNIANVNTPGYSMQRPDLVSRENLGGV
jgi:flagellar hook-associated protein 1 FlgK